jgi:hypothetical protein
MKVVKTSFNNENKAQLAMILANEQRDTLEIALWEYVKAKGLLNPQKVMETVNKIYEEPFDSKKKYSLEVIKSETKEEAIILGTPEIV